jgi:hypothetical protein
VTSSHSTWLRVETAVVAVTLMCFGTIGQADELELKWVTSWAVQIQAAYVAPPAHDSKPNLSVALPNATATNQTFRMIVKPRLWGQLVRIRLSNVFGTQPVTFSTVSIAFQKSQANIVRDSSRTVTFGGAERIEVPAGRSVFSDAVALRSITQFSLFGSRKPQGGSGRNLAVSFTVSGSSGPISFQPDADTTSYISPWNSGDSTAAEDGKAFPFSTTSSFFLSELDVAQAAETVVLSPAVIPRPTALSARQ